MIASQAAKAVSSAMNEFVSSTMHSARWMTMIRVCDTTDVPVILEVINDAAQAYKGVIPGDAWHEPYMSMSELESEIAKGVRFYGCEMGGRMLGVMGIQDVKD